MTCRAGSLITFAGVIVSALFAASTPAVAASDVPTDAGCFDDGACYVESNSSGDATKGDAAAKDSKPKKESKPPTPQCSGLPAGVLAPAGTPADALPEDEQPDPDWVRVTCLSGGDAMWLWLDPQVNAESLARNLLSRMQLEPIEIGWTPLRSPMGYVGVPTWLWVADPGRLTWGPASISAGGISLTARVESVSWSMGNGDVVRCANAGTPWRRGMGMDPSPTCGYTYEQQGDYRVVATSHWVARWTGYGQSGQIPFEVSQERLLEIGELQVIVGR